MKQEDVTVLLAELQREWPILDTVSFNELNIGDKLVDQPYQLVRFQEKLIREKARMEELLDIKTRLIGKKYDNLRFHYEKALTNREIEQYYLPRDKDIILANDTISRQNVIIEYFETAVKAINQMQWSIKLFLEDRKYSG